MRVVRRFGLVPAWSVVLAFAALMGFVSLGSADAASTVTPGTYKITLSGDGTIGTQPFTLTTDDAPTFTVNIDATGNITAPPSGVYWPDVTFVSDAVGGNAVTGKLDPVTGALSLIWRFHIQMADPGTGMTISVGSAVSPIVLNLNSTTSGGVAFNSSTRRATIVDRTIAFPGATCFGLWCGFVIPPEGKTPAQLVNEQLGIPTAPGASSFNMVAEFDRSPMGGVTPPPPGPVDLVLDKSHVGNFLVGVDDTYSLAVSNSGGTASSGVVTVADTLPEGLEFKSFSGAGWSCTRAGQVVTCTSAAPIAAGAAASPLSLTVTPSEQGSVTNTATVSGGGQASGGNDTDEDETVVKGFATEIRPNVSLSKSHVGNFKVGVDGTYLLAVSNTTGSAPASAVTVTDTLPAGLSYKSFSGDGWSCAPVGQVVTCSLSAPIAAGAAASPLSLTVTPSATAVPQVTNTATVTGDSLTDDTDDADSDLTTVEGVEPPPGVVDLALDKSHVGALHLAVPGTYSLDVSNEGDTASSGEVKVVDTLPDGLQYVSSTGDGWSCAPAGQVVTCTSSAPIAAGADASPLSLTVTPLAAGEVTNTATVSGGGQASGGNDTDSDPTTVLDSTTMGADLALDKSHVGELAVDVDGTYSLDVSNEGDIASSGEVKVVDTLPDRLSYKGFSGDGWSCAPVGQVVTCTSSAPIAAGADASPLSLTVTPLAAGEVTNTATVSGGGQASGGNDTDSDQATVDGDVVPPPDEPDLELDKYHEGDFAVDVDGVYSLAVSNVGAAASSGEVTVTDTLPVGMAYKGFAGTGWSCAPVGQVVTCTSSAPIAAGASAEALSLTVTPSVAAAVVNDASVSGGGETNNLNNGASDPTTIRGDEPPPPEEADLTLDKSHRGNFVVGRRGWYRLVVSNAGTESSAGDVTVVDTLPEGMEYRWGGGEGWSCEADEQVVTCTSAESVAAGDSAAPLLIKVRPTKRGEVTNTAVVFGGGQSNTDNDTASDPTEVKRRRHWCRRHGYDNGFWWFWHTNAWGGHGGHDHHWSGHS